MSVQLQPSGPEKILCRGRLIELAQQEMSDGARTCTFEFARRGPGTRIMFCRDDKWLIAREYRYENGTFDMRLPGGKVFDTLQEYETARSNDANFCSLARATITKEALEEVGLRPTSLEFFHKSVCGATVRWDLFYFICQAWDVCGEPQLEFGEDITFDWYSSAQVKQMCLTGEVSEDRSAIALLRAIEKLRPGS